MEYPKITVDGQLYTMEVPKASMWRKWMAFDKEKGNLAAEDYIDRHCQLIAEVFPGLTAEKILDNVALDEIMLIYNQCLKALMNMLSSKLEVLAKNVVKAES